MRFVYIWGLLFLLGASWAQGLDATRDPRLNQPVSLRVPATPLYQLLRQLEKQTGVELRVESRLRDYRAFARLQNRPLHEVLRLLAEAFSLEWRAEPVREGEDAPLRYVLYQPDAERQREQAYRNLLSTDTLTLVQEALRYLPDELLSGGYESLCNALGLQIQVSAGYINSFGAPRMPRQLPSPSEKGARAQAVIAMRDLLLRHAASCPEAYFAVLALKHMTDADWHALRTASCLRIPAERVPAALREQWLREQLRLHGYTEEEIANYQEPPEAEADNPEEEMRLDLQSRLHAIQQGKYSGVLFFDSQSARLKVAFEVFTPSGTIHSGYADLDGVALLQAMLTPVGKPEQPEWLAQVPDLPIQPITEKAWRQALQRNWAEWQSFRIVEGLTTAQAEGVGEFYPLSATQYWGRERWRATLQQLLREYAITLREGVLIFQARERYLGRALNIPQASLASWLSEPIPSIDALALIASRLSQRQIESLARCRLNYLETYEREPFEARHHMDVWRDILHSISDIERLLYALRWYAALNYAQRAALKRGASIPYEALSPPQRALFEATVWNNEWFCFEAQPDSLRDAYAQLSFVASESEVRSWQSQRAIQMPRRGYQFVFCLTDGGCHFADLTFHIPPQ
ncbi:MAG: hypothetical protein NZ556_02255 [Fimbriimonadales bacterium]|nr:hypothetical protein [Fimbriimonadales bacterium]